MAILYGYCRKPGCAREPAKRRGYCSEHLYLDARRDHARRASADARGYDSQWRRARGLFLREFYLCGMTPNIPRQNSYGCLHRGETRAGVEVDHIRPITEGGAMFDEQNLQSLCAACHRIKTAAERRAAIASSTGEKQEGGYG